MADELATRGDGILRLVSREGEVGQGSTIVTAAGSSYKGFRFPPEIISPLRLAVPPVPVELPRRAQDQAGGECALFVHRLAHGGEVGQFCKGAPG